VREDALSGKNLAIVDQLYRRRILLIYLILPRRARPTRLAPSTPVAHDWMILRQHPACGDIFGEFQNSNGPAKTRVTAISFQDAAGYTYGQEETGSNGVKHARQCRHS